MHPDPLMCATGFHLCERQFPYYLVNLNFPSQWLTVCGCSHATTGVGAAACRSQDQRSLAVLSTAISLQQDGCRELLVEYSEILLFSQKKKKKQILNT